MIIELMSQCSNRTFMELKYDFNLDHSLNNLF